MVTLHKNAKMNVIITGSRPATAGAAASPPGGATPAGAAAVRTLSGRKGKIFHVAKLWGIIDLGKHEHVFFDKSIMKRPLEDLQKDFRVGETLNFNAVLAPKTSRAKWRAIHVWKEAEEQPSAGETETEFSRAENDESPLLSPAISIEEEINRFLPPHVLLSDSGGDVEPGDTRYIDLSPRNSITIVTGPGGDAAGLDSSSGSSSATDSGGGAKPMSPPLVDDARPRVNGSTHHAGGADATPASVAAAVAATSNKPKMTTLNIAGNKVRRSIRSAGRFCADVWLCGSSAYR